MIKVMTKEIAIHNLYALKQRTRALSDNEALDLAIKALEQEPCEDAISREAVLNLFNKSDEYRWETTWIRHKIEELPSVTPKFTDTEIQKMQELEQAQLEKTYELGKSEMQSCEDCISRTALLAKIDEERKHLLDLKMDGAEHILVHHARRIIEDMPAVTPKESEGNV